MDDLERIPVGVEYIGGIVSRIVFQSRAGRNVVPGTSGHCGLVECIDLVFIFGHETPVNGCWIRLPLLYPEERLLAVTKSPQIGMTVFALVRHEEFDIKRLQGCLIEGQRTFDIADGQNNVVEHSSPSQITSASTAFSPLLLCSCDLIVLLWPLRTHPGAQGHAKDPLHGEACQSMRARLHAARARERTHDGQLSPLHLPSTQRFMPV